MHVRRLMHCGPTAWAVKIVAVAVIGILLILPFLSAALDGGSPYWVDTVTASLITAILIMSLNLAMGFTGMFSFVQTGLLAIGGYTAAATALHLHWSPWLAIGGAVVCTAAFAFVMTSLTLRAASLYWGLITLSVDLVIVQVADQWAGVTGGFNGLFAVPRPGFGGTALDDNQFFYVVMVATMVAYVVQRNLVRSSTGRRFQAIRESWETSQSLGINVNATRLLSFTLSGALAGLAGAMYAQYYSSVSPDVASQAGALSLFVGLFLGGFGTLLGPLIGSGLVSAVDSLTRGVAQYQQIILGSFLLLAIFIVPRGLVGSITASRWGTFLALDVPERRSPDDEDVVGTSAGRLKSFLYSGRALPEAPSDRDGVPMPIIKADVICKSFGGVAAVSNVSLACERGEIHGLIGPNGAGKSTLVSCLTGQVRPDSGSIWIKGAKAPTRAHAIARLGVTRVFQVPHLFQDASAVDNVLTGMCRRSRISWFGAIIRTTRFRREEIAHRSEASDLLSLVGMSKVGSQPCSTLSHGQKRLVEVMRAVSTRPSLLILDEPATGLTNRELQVLEELVRELARSGIGILLIEHNIGLVMRLCDRVTVLSVGSVIACGSPAEVSASEVVQIAYLGGTSHPSDAPSQEVDK